MPSDYSDLAAAPSSTPLHSISSMDEEDDDEIEFVPAQEEAVVDDSQESDEEYEEAGSIPMATVTKQKQVTKMNKKKTDLEVVAEGPPRELVIATALLPPPKRFETLPECFQKAGRLKRPWSRVLSGDIAKTKEERKTKKPQVTQGEGYPTNSESVFVVSDEEDSEPGADAQINKEVKLTRQKLIIKAPFKLEPKHPQSSKVHFSFERPSSSKAASVGSFHLIQKDYPAALEAPEPSPITPVGFGTPTPIHHGNKAPHKTSKHLSVGDSELADSRPRQDPIKAVQHDRYTCSMVGCKSNTFEYNIIDANDIRLKQAHESNRMYGFWFCPSCEEQVKAVHTRSSFHEPDLRPVQPPPAKSKSKFSTKFGEDFLDDDDIRDPLLYLAGLVEQYTANACTEPLAFLPTLPIHKLPCIVDEDKASEKLVPLLRKVLDIPIGISIRDAARNRRLEDDFAFWVNNALIFIIAEWVFQTGSPFQSHAIWIDTLEYAGIPAVTIQELIQDNRRRIIKAVPRPADFAARLQSRHDKLVKNLNATMLPLVGFSEKIDETHRAIANAAQELNLLISTYKSNYEVIWPKMGDEFNKREHITNSPLSKQHEERTILLTKMFGLKVEIEGGKWRICRKAEVDLLPDTRKPDAPASVIPQKRKRNAAIKE